MARMHQLAGSLILTALVAALPAQDLTRRAPPQTKPVAIEHATLHRIVHAPIEDGTILFTDGKIMALGPAAEVELPVECERIDGRGLHVYPGLIAPYTQLGLVELGQVRATIDHSELGEFTPEVRAAVAVNPDSTVIPVTRSNGVLIAGVFPQGTAIPGRAAVIQLEGWTWEEMALVPDAGLVVDWPAIPVLPRAEEDVRKKAREAALARRAAIDAEFSAARASLAARRSGADVPLDVRHAAMARAIESDTALFLAADDAEEISSGVHWAISRGMRPILLGGREADLCLELLRHHDVPVILRGVHRLPRRDDSPVDEPFRLPAMLHEAGVRFCLGNAEEFYNARNLPHEAGTAVAHGLPAAAALRAITLSAAEILGIADRAGSLAPGKDATLFVSDGDPLEITTQVRLAFIQGKRLDLTNKQLELYDKYRDR